MYGPGTYGALANGRKLRLFEAWIQAREASQNGIAAFPDEVGWAQEAMSVNDFPTYLTKYLRHRFIQRFNEVQGAWRSYVRPFENEDFETFTSSRFGRFPNIPEKAVGGPYDEIALQEGTGPSLFLREFGATWSLTRKMIISDHLEQFTNLPDLAAQALARTVSQEAAVNVLQANPNTFDGNALISTQHSNKGTTALTNNVAGMNAVVAGDLALSKQTDQEGYLIVPPGGRKLVIPIELKWIANALNTQSVVDNAGILYPNQVQGLFDEIVVEPFFTDLNNWYILSDATGEFAPLAYVTLTGQSEPFVGIQDPGSALLSGGQDPYSFEFDQLQWKLRHDYNFQAIEWRGIYGAIVP